MVHFEKQASRMGADIRFGIATRVDFSSTPIKSGSKRRRSSKLTPSSSPRAPSAKWLGLESEQRLNGYGVSACAVCDGFFFRNKEVAIVGAGDTAAEEALYLSKLCTTVHMLIRSDKMRASRIMQERVQQTPNIKIYWNSETDEVLGESRVDGLRIRNRKTDDKRVIPISGFFVAIGHQPNSGIFSDFLDMDEAGYIKTIPGTARTNVEGVFAAGDVQDKIYRQAVTAAGSGCMAALDAERYLSAKGLA